MLTDTAHVQRDYNSSAQVVLIEKRRIDSHLVAFNVFFDEPNYLGKQILTAPLPRSFHLFVNIARGGKHNLLRSETVPKLPQIDLRYLSQVRLAIDSRGKLRQGWSLVSVEQQRLRFRQVEGQCRSVFVVNPHHVRPCNLVFLALR